MYPLCSHGRVTFPFPHPIGFTMMMASGPFTTSDSLDMAPLHDLLAVVSREGPSVLLLVNTHISSLSLSTLSTIFIR